MKKLIKIKTKKYSPGLLRELLTNSCWTITAQVFISLAALALTFVLSNSLNQYSFGVYRFVNYLIPLLLLTLMPGLNISTIYSIAQKKKVRVKPLMLLKLKYSLPGVFIMLIISLFYLLVKHNYELALIFSFMAITIPISEILYVYYNYLFGLNDFKHLSLYEIFTKGFQTISVILTAITTNNIVLILFSLFISKIVARTIIFIISYKNINAILDKFNENNTKNITSHGKTLSIQNVYYTIMENIDKIIVWTLFGPVVLASYYIAIVVPVEISKFFNFIHQVSFPKFIALDLKEKHTLRKIMNILSLISLLLFIISFIYIPISKLVITLAFPKYMHVINAAMAASLLLFMIPTNNVLIQLLIAAKKEVYLIRSHIFTSIVYTVIVTYVYFNYNTRYVLTLLIISLILKYATSIFINITMLRYSNKNKQQLCQ